MSDGEAGFIAVSGFGVVGLCRVWDDFLSVTLHGRFEHEGPFIIQKSRGLEAVYHSPGRSHAWHKSG